MCVIENCDLENFENKDKCILHCEKDDWYVLDKKGNKNWDESTKRIIMFWEVVQDIFNTIYEYRIKKIDNSYMQDYTFNEVKFPIHQNEVEYCIEEDDDGYLIKDNRDEQGTNFYSFLYEINNLNKIVDELNISFINCEFLDKLNLKKYNLTGFLNFSNCTFNDNVYLANKNNNIIQFTDDSKFQNCTLDLSNKTFTAQINLINCINIDKLKCVNTKFNIVSLRGTTINNGIFSRSTFNGKSSFINTTFKERTSFSHTTFNKICSFRDSIFEGGLDFTDTIFNENVNFLDIDIEKAECNRETARIIKDSFEKQNNIIEANRFYTLEMKEREKELDGDIKKGKNFFEWLTFKIHGITSDHSQDWLLSIFWILNITMVLPVLKLMSPITSSIFLVVYFYYLTDLKLEYKRYRGWILIPFTFINYSFLNTLLPTLTLDDMAKEINPFSIMTWNSPPLTFGLFIYKILIAYLIYQLIISIRQNTRRK
jgi:hypothetical protein